MSNADREEFTELDWIALKQDIGSEALAFHQETAGEKFKRKFYENPFVPIGCGLTATALGFGLWSFRKGERQMSQKMMRLRIVGQGFTIGALMFGIFTASMRG